MSVRWEDIVTVQRRRDGWYVVTPDGRELGPWATYDDALRYSYRKFHVG